MTEGRSLDDILNDREPTAEVETPEAEPETQEQPEIEAEAPPVEGQPRDEHGRFAPKGEKESAPPAPQETEGHIPVAALKDERSKRQALEAELNQLRAQIAQQQQPALQAQPTVQGPPDRWEDPEGYDRWLIGQAAEQARSEAVQAVQMQRIEASAMRARSKYPDYAEKHQVFGEMLNQNPALFDRMMQAEDPAEFAYAQAKTEVELRQYGGIDALVEARVQARLAEQAPPSLNQVALPSAPPTISDSRSTGPRSGPAWGGPTALSDILR